MYEILDQKQNVKENVTFSYNQGGLLAHMKAFLKGFLLVPAFDKEKQPRSERPPCSKCLPSLPQLSQCPEEEL